jgi:PAS domain S-box-containing protein
MELIGTNAGGGAVFIVNDIAHDPGFAQFRDEALKRGYRSYVAIPLLVNGLSVGVLNFLSSEKGFFDPDAVDLLNSLAHNISVAMEAAESDAKRRHSEEALWRAEKRYRDLIDNISEGIYQATIDGEFLMVNRAMATIFGYESPKDLLLSVTDVGTQCYVNSDDRKAFISQVIAEGRADKFELQARKKDGTAIWISLSSRIVTDDQGHQLYVEGTAEDVTERRHAYDMLMRSKEDWEQTFNAVPDLILIVDQDYRISNMNSAMAMRLGLARDEAMGKFCYETLHATPQPSDFCPHLRVMKEGESSDQEFFDPKLNGYFHLTVSPLFDETGMFRGTVHVYRDISARKSAEQMIRESERKYRGIFDDSPIAMAEEDFSDVKVFFDKLRSSAVVDFRHYFDENPGEVARLAGLVRVIDINAASVKLLGASDKAQVLRDLRSYFTENSLITLKEKMIALAEGSTRFETEIEVLNVKGEPRLLDLALIVQPGYELTLSRVLISFIDITERRLAEETVKNALHLFQLTLSSLNEAVLIADADTRTIYECNRTAEEMFGYRREELIGRTTEFLHVNGMMFLEFGRKMTEGLMKDDHCHFEFEMKRSNGEIFQTEHYLRPLISDRGFRALVGVISDISDRKEAEETKRKYEQMISTIPDPMTLVDRNYRYLAVNRAAAAFLYRHVSDIVGHPVAELLGHEVFEQFVLPNLDRCFAGEEVHYHAWFDFPGMGKRYMRVSYYPLAEGTEGVVAAIVHSSDITEHKRAEEREKALQARLIHADKMKSLGILVSSVAHEVNNPNNFILFNSSILANAWKDIQRILDLYMQDHGDYSLAGLPYSEMRDAIPKLFTGITDGSQRIKAIVEKLKDFARTDRGSLEGEVDMKKVVRDAVMILQSQIKKHTDYFNVAIEEGLPPVKGNHQQLEQVMINLMMNALQALRERSEAVEVKVRYDANGRAVQVSIRDEGCGMTADVLEKVTEPFFTTKLDSGGTGLGLSISRSIVDDHRGTLTFTSERGKGTTAILRLPT